MKTENVWIASVHPDPSKPLALDLKHILSSLRPHLPRWIWCVRNLDWFGEGAEPTCQRVEATGSSGLWMTSEDLLREARHAYQTIEGQFLAFPRDMQQESVTARDLDLRAFPESRAELAIVAVDGGFFEVYAKDGELVTSLKRLGDVRDEDPERYF